LQAFAEFLSKITEGSGAALHCPRKVTPEGRNAPHGAIHQPGFDGDIGHGVPIPFFREAIETRVNKQRKYALLTRA
jgi:hypothetical protein